jgi:PIN domain nuclease of toxin-antitoxin system
MNLLLDTHILLWWLAEGPQLSKTDRAHITDARAVYVSAASAWEISIKKSAGKLDAPDNLAEVLQTNRFKELPVTLEHAVAAGKLPRHHGDPFDRMLLAQARSESLTLMTHDSRLDKYGVPLIVI